MHTQKDYTFQNNAAIYPEVNQHNVRHVLHHIHDVSEAQLF